MAIERDHDTTAPLFGLALATLAFHQVPREAIIDHLGPLIPSMLRRVRALTTVLDEIRNGVISSLDQFAAVNDLPTVPTCASSACPHRIDDTRPDKLSLCASCEMVYVCSKSCFADVRCFHDYTDAAQPRLARRPQAALSLS